MGHGSAWRLRDKWNHFAQRTEPRRLLSYTLPKSSTDKCTNIPSHCRSDCAAHPRPNTSSNNGVTHGDTYYSDTDRGPHRTADGYTHNGGTYNTAHTQSHGSTNRVAKCCTHGISDKHTNCNAVDFSYGHAH